MTNTPTTGRRLYSPFAFEMHKDPYAMYEYLLEEDPVQHHEASGFWSIARFEDVWQASRDWQTFSSACSPVLNIEVPMPILLTMDPPDHNRLRSLVSMVFTPGAINSLESDIRNNVRNCLDKLSEAGEFDLVGDFSEKFPMATMSMMLGIPEQDRNELQHWSRVGMQRKPGDTQIPEAAQIAMGKSVNYFAHAIRERRAQPQQDLMSRLVHAQAKTGHGQRRSLSDAELLGFLLMFVTAGYETVMRFTGLMAYQLFRHPDTRRELVEQPGLIPQAIEECLRFDNPGQYLARVPTRDVVVQGVTIPRGAQVILLHGAAMRDRREFDAPDTLDIHRRIPRQLGFGNGAHLCLGAALARLECRIAFEELLKRFPHYSVDETRMVYSHCANVRGFDYLPIRATG